MRKSLEDACNDALQEIIITLKPKYVIGIGGYSRDLCLKIKANASLTSEILYLIHPSPIIPNNQNWPEKALQFLQEQKLLHYFKDD